MTVLQPTGAMRGKMSSRVCVVALLAVPGSLTCYSADARAPPAGLASSVRSQAVADDVDVSWGVAKLILTKQQETNTAVPLCISNREGFKGAGKLLLICLLAQELL